MLRTLTISTIYTEHVIPTALKVPGVLKMVFTRLYSFSEDQPDGLSDIHVMAETHFESVEILHQFLNSPEGIELCQKAVDFSSIGVYMAKEKVFHAPKRMPERNRDIVDVYNNDDQ